VPIGGTDKIARAEALQALIRAGRVAMVRAPWNDIILHEWYAFPGRNDDSVDAANLFARVIHQMPAGAKPSSSDAGPARNMALPAGVPDGHVFIGSDGRQWLNPGDALQIDNLQPRRQRRIGD
jgi:hypothetical protein